MVGSFNPSDAEFLWEHCFERRRDAPKTCAYCEAQTFTFCSGCQQYICEKLECRRKHLREFGLTISEQDGTR
jgi:hypothetical protein